MSYLSLGSRRLNAFGSFHCKYNGKVVQAENAFEFGAKTDAARNALAVSQWAPLDNFGGSRTFVKEES